MQFPRDGWKPMEPEHKTALECHQINREKDNSSFNLLKFSVVWKDVGALNQCTLAATAIYVALIEELY